MLVGLVGLLAVFVLDTVLAAVVLGEPVVASAWHSAMVLTTVDGGTGGHGPAWFLLQSTFTLLCVLGFTACSPPGSSTGSPRCVSPAVPLAKSLGIPVMFGRGGDRFLLGRLALTRARAIVAVSSNVLENIAVAVAARAAGHSDRCPIGQGNRLPVGHPSREPKGALGSNTAPKATFGSLGIDIDVCQYRRMSNPPDAAGQPCSPPLAAEPLPRHQAAELAHTFKALGDPARLRLLSLIASHVGGQACVCDLIGSFDLSQPTISHHLKVLREAGLVTSERRGSWVHYRVRQEVLDRLAAALVPATQAVPA